MSNRLIDIENRLAALESGAGDSPYAALEDRVDSLECQAVGYADQAEVDQRISAIEAQLSALQKARRGGKS